MLGQLLKKALQAAKNPAQRKQLVELFKKVVEIAGTVLTFKEIKDIIEETFGKSDAQQQTSAETLPEQSGETTPEPPQTESEQLNNIENQVIDDNLQPDEENQAACEPPQQEAPTSEQPGDRSPSSFPEYTTLEQLRIHAPTEYIDAVIANKVKALVEQGIETERGKFYATDKLIVSTNNEGVYTLYEPQGEMSMQFLYPEADSEIPQVLFKREMSHELQLDLLAATPSIVSQELSEANLDQVATVTDVAMTVLGTDEALQLADGSRVYEGSVYRFEQQDDTLRVSTNDGRGEIFRMVDGEVEVFKLNEADIARFERANDRFQAATQELFNTSDLVESGAYLTSMSTAKKRELER